jgi:hypothetical protein
MLRLFAFTFSAVTLRLLLRLGITSGIRFVEKYELAAVPSQSLSAGAPARTRAGDEAQAGGRPTGAGQMFVAT